MVLEYADGGDLYKQIVKRRTAKKYFSETTILNMFEQICQGLCALHEMGIIHRDIKSLNILLTRPDKGGDPRNHIPTVKIGDLGVGRELSIETVMVNTFYGTPLYASPELCENKPYNELTDIWSLGVVLYELCALQHPFTGRNLMALAGAISKAEYAPIPDQYSSFLVDLIAALLNKNQKKRPRIREILGWLNKEGHNSQPSTPQDEGMPSRRRERAAEDRERHTRSQREGMRSTSPDREDDGGKAPRGQSREKQRGKEHSSRNSRAGSIAGDRPPSLYSSQQGTGNKHVDRAYKSRPHSSHSRASKSRAGSSAGDRPPATGDSRETYARARREKIRPSSGSGVSSSSRSRGGGEADPGHRGTNGRGGQERGARKYRDREEFDRERDKIEYMKKMRDKELRDEAEHRRRLQQQKALEEREGQQREREERRRKEGPDNERRRDNRLDSEAEAREDHPGGGNPSSRGEANEWQGKRREASRAQDGKGNSDSERDDDWGNYSFESKDKAVRPSQRGRVAVRRAAGSEDTKGSSTRRKEESDSVSDYTGQHEEDRRSIVSSTPSYRARIKDWERRQKDETEGNSRPASSSRAPSSRSSKNSFYNGHSSSDNRRNGGHKLSMHERLVEKRERQAKRMDEQARLGGDRSLAENGNKHRGEEGDERLGGALPSRYREPVRSKDPYDLSVDDDWSSQRNHEKRQEEQRLERARKKERRARRQEDERRRRRRHEESSVESKVQRERPRRHKTSQSDSKKAAQPDPRVGQMLENKAFSVSPSRARKTRSDDKYSDRRASSRERDYRGNKGSERRERPQRREHADHDALKLQRPSSRGSSRMSTITGSPRRQALYFENEIRRQQTHLRRLYAAAEWITSDAPEDRRERDDIENQIQDVLYYIDDLEDQLQDLKQALQENSSDGGSSRKSRNDRRPRVAINIGDCGDADDRGKDTSRSSSSRHSFQHYISFDD